VLEGRDGVEQVRDGPRQQRGRGDRRHGAPFDAPPEEPGEGQDREAREPEVERHAHDALGDVAHLGDAVGGVDLVGDLPLAHCLELAAHLQPAQRAAPGVHAERERGPEEDRAEPGDEEEP
jgi:hypothetical protein